MPMPQSGSTKRPEIGAGRVFNEGSDSLTSIARLLTQYLQGRDELRPKPQSIVVVHVDAMQMALTAHLNGLRIPNEHDMLMGLARMAMQFP
jgi:hypothetical protein